MMYVVKFNERVNNWTFFATFEAASEWLSSYRPTPIKPELNLMKSCA